MLDLSQLLDPAVRFFVARRGGVALGCGSILLGQEHGELKRFFVADAARGQGVGAGLIAAVEQAAREAGNRPGCSSAAIGASVCRCRRQARLRAIDERDVDGSGDV